MFLRYGITIVWLLITPTAHAAEFDQRIDRTFQHIAATTRFSLADSGGSKGSYGTTVGVGLTDAALIEGDSYASEVLGRLASPESEENQRWLQVSAMRGTDWPIDLGVSVGQLQQTQINQLSGIAQATVFEMFGWPSVTLRYQYSQLLGLQSATEVRSNQVEVIVTQGLWRYFTGYASAALERTSIDLRIRNSETLSLNSAGVYEAQRDVDSFILKAGLQIMAWPPFVHLSGEGHVDQHQNRGLSLKLNWLI